MLQPKVKNLYEEARNNKEFQAELKIHEPLYYYKPTILWKEEEKILLATIYMGFLMAKGEYSENNYIK